MACLRPGQADRIKERVARTNLPIEVHSGRTAEIIHLAHSCIAVSGSVSLELLYRKKPAMIIYRTNRIGHAAFKLLKTCPYICLVNLLAGKRLLPEWLSTHLDPLLVSGPILEWLNDYLTYKRLCDEMEELRNRVLKPGACSRAADRIMDVLTGPEKERSRIAA
jgi:lipid-A-disaccharide synthase